MKSNHEVFGKTPFYVINCTLSRSICTIPNFSGQGQASFPQEILETTQLLSLAQGKRRDKEKLWEDFFSDPSQWWDYRSSKMNQRFPDFKHKQTLESLWITSKWNPPWVTGELASMSPGRLERSVFAWNQMISKCNRSGQYEKTIDLFEQMLEHGIHPNSYVFVNVLKACAGLHVLEIGKRVHMKIKETSYESDVYVGTSLIDMYTNCRSLDDAWQVFTKMPSKDVVAWNAMIMGSVKCGQGQNALKLFQQMLQEGVVPDSVTYAGVLNACANEGALDVGRYIHEQIKSSVCEFDTLLCNSLVEMYAKCGSINDAWTVFKKMSSCDVVAWNAMIMGSSKCGQGLEAFYLFQKMQLEGIAANSATFVGLLNACASLAALNEGRCVHELIKRSGYDSAVFVSSSLVDMYSKCGSIEDAEKVFITMPMHSLVCWNSMIGGYAMHGYASKAIVLFERMCLESLKVDEVTFIGILSACSHGGLVEEGLHYFEVMNLVYNLRPKMEHYTCIVDLLGRAGRLVEAEDMVKTMSVKPDALVWMALLSACRVHGNVEMGECAAKRVLELDPESSGAYGLLSNIYSAAGLWDLRAMVRRQRLVMGVKKLPGCTWIEINNELHSFGVDDFKHPQIREIRAELSKVLKSIKRSGYIPDTRFALRNVTEKAKINQLSRHSEKIAIAFGLISTPAGTPLRAMNSLRICGDCHTAMKVISKLVGRTIMLRDTNRFHHFQDGLCSCKDYW